MVLENKFWLKKQRRQCWPSQQKGQEQLDQLFQTTHVIVIVSYIARSNVTSNSSHTEVTEPMMETKDNDNDQFLSTASCGTSPMDSGNNDASEVIYEINSDDPADDPNANDLATDDLDTERPAESAQAKLSMHPPCIPVYYLHVVMLSPDHLANDWTSPIYVFFHCTPHIEYVDSRQVHIFECTASHCKSKHGHDVRCFLDTGDAKSTSNLHQHAKTCWGNKGSQCCWQYKKI